MDFERWAKGEMEKTARAVRAARRLEEHTRETTRGYLKEMEALLADLRTKHPPEKLRKIEAALRDMRAAIEDP